MRKSHSKLAAEFYDKIIKLHHEEFAYKKIHYKKWLDLLSSELKKSSTILDLGCGNGRALKYLIDKGFQGIGIDVSNKMLKLAEKYVPEGKFYKQDFKDVDFKSESIDAVISFFALNHISKTEFKKTIENCKKILKQNGLLLLGMVKGKKEGFFKGFYGKKLKLYGAGYTEEELEGILTASGFDILKIKKEHFKGKHFEENNIYILAKVKK